MTNWRITFVNDGWKSRIVSANTLDEAIKLFMEENRDVPGSALLSIMRA